MQDNAGNRMKGFKYLLQAAEAGDRSSMIIVARAFDSGVNLSADRWVSEFATLLPPGGNLNAFNTVEFPSNDACVFLSAPLKKAELGRSASLVWHCLKHDRLWRRWRVWWDAGWATVPAAGQRGGDVPGGRLQPHSWPTKSRFDSIPLSTHLDKTSCRIVYLFLRVDADNCHCLLTSDMLGLQVICLQKQQKLPCRPWKVD